MGDVKVNGYADEYGDGRIFCSQLNTYGQNMTKMYWFDTPAYPEDDWDAHYGWYDIDGEQCFNNSELCAGGALFFTVNEKSSYTLLWPSPLPEKE